MIHSSACSAPKLCTASKLAGIIHRATVATLNAITVLHSTWEA